MREPHPVPPKRAGAVECSGCTRCWPVRDGIPRILSEGRLGSRDKAMRCVYDAFAPFHDMAVDHVLPLVQRQSARSLRASYIEHIELDGLEEERGDSDAPIRILEVGAGAGANLRLVSGALSDARVEYEYWVLDMSENMMSRAIGRSAELEGGVLAGVLGDAHYLPFEEAAFDRVFHVGGIAAYDDPQRALREMARVAKPGTPIVVVDEQLDPRGTCLFQRLAYDLLTIGAPHDGAPDDDLLPEGTEDRLVEQITSFYYCLRFRWRPPAAEAATS